MGKAEFGTPKYIAKQIKSKGLQKVKFYCQICEKQCRDANGFKNHILSASHVGRMQNIGTSKKNIEEKVSEYSKLFEQDFLRLLKAAHGHKKVNANKYYQEYILSDKNHVHLNATRYSSLLIFVIKMAQLGKIAIEGVDLDKLKSQSRDDDDGEEPLNMQYTTIYIPENKIKEHNKKIEKENSEKSDEQVHMMMLQRTIERNSKRLATKKDDELTMDNDRSAQEKKNHSLEMEPIRISIAMNNINKKKSLKERRVALGFKKR